MPDRRAHFHPIFYGSFDWHSCVHGWWTLLTLRRLFPEMREAPAIAELADDSFTPDKVAVELRLSRPADCRPGSSGPMAGDGCSICTSKLRGTTIGRGRPSWSRWPAPLPNGFTSILPS